MKNSKEKTSNIELLNDINQMFVIRLTNIIYRLKYDLKNSKSKKIIEAYKAKVSTLFGFYRDMILVVDPNATYISKRSLKKDETHKSCFDKEDYINECIGVLTYKGIEFPIFNDEYGMQDYIEFMDEAGNIQSADALADWDYLYESHMILNKLLQVKTIKDCDKILDYIETSPLFKTF